MTTAIIETGGDSVVLQGAFSGSYSTPVGYTKTTGSPDTPVRRRVVIMDQASCKPVREMWSGRLTGAWQFHDLAAGKYFVVSFDHTGLYSGVIETDIVVPAP